MDLTDLTEREHLKLTTLEYYVEEEGNFLGEPIVTLFARDERGNRRVIEVEGFYPRFYITEDEFREHEQELFTESRIREIVTQPGVASVDYLDNAALCVTDDPPRRTLHDEPLVEIETVVPNHVADLREFFDETWEADVLFTNRFLVDSGIHDGFSIPRGEDRVHYDEIEPSEQVPEIPPRMVTIDIEVWTGGTFPDPSEARQPVTAVTAYDNYDDEYRAAVLHPDAIAEGDEHTWDDPDFDEGVEVFHDEATMLGAFNEWIVAKDPDMLSGWNSSTTENGRPFDYPYWINRCERINEWTYRDLSPTDTCFVTNYGTPVCGGRVMFDMLQAYKKTQIHEKRSYSLNYIAEEELGYGKEDIEDTDHGWLHEPAAFMDYNVRDVEAVVEIESAKSVLSIYDHIRSIAGVKYGEIAESNIGIIDVLYLREARMRGIALPTSTKPDVQHYWGAYVFDPVPGKHTNVVYPDLSSLYPNLFRDMNASPETIVGDEEDLRDSPYSEHDCHTVYVDPRSEREKKDADSPEREVLYVLKPEVKESFVRDVIDDLIDMKYEYKSDEYDREAYEAIKRITNSVYGCMGDSKSYGTGFRLFDWRIAEAITLAGRDVIKHTADEFEQRVHQLGYPDAEIVAGDTDSCVCAIESADGMEETLDVARAAVEYVDMTYEEFMYDRFGIEDGNMAVEIESYARSALFMDKKKRYAQWIRWDEGDLVDRVEYKGFELVRSDSAEITAETQAGVIERILKNDDPKPIVSEYLRSVWDDVLDGAVDLERLGRPKSLGNPIMDYGWSEREVEPQEAPMEVGGVELETGDTYTTYYTPQPHIRGARYASAYIEGEQIEEGDKPLFLYIEGVRPNPDYPETYDYEDHYSLNAPENSPDENEREMKEIGAGVDAISVSMPENIPDPIVVDYETMAEKTVRDPIEPIVEVLGWDFDDLITEGSQTDIAQFM